MSGALADCLGREIDRPALAVARRQPLRVDNPGFMDGFGRFDQLSSNVTANPIEPPAHGSSLRDRHIRAAIESKSDAKLYEPVK
jgi:hypothetical protein